MTPLERPNAPTDRNGPNTPNSLGCALGRQLPGITVDEASQGRDAALCRDSYPASVDLARKTGDEGVLL